ncbi:MAG: hypothetical protein AAGP08_06710 [Pseudomonadota bacterium]
MIELDTHLRETRVRYAKVPTRTEVKTLSARLFLPDRAQAPLLIWLHAGGFRTGNIDHPRHPLIAEAFAAHGIATACVEYRLRCPRRALSEQSKALFPRLRADAAAQDYGLRSILTGAAAIGAMESVILFLKWRAEQGKRHGLGNRTLLGGSSAGAITVLNTLVLAPHLGIRLPRIEAACVQSGAFAYPSFASDNRTPILAVHNPNDPRVPIASIRAFAARTPACTLIESSRQPHGSLSHARKEPLSTAVARVITFARENGARL